MDTYKTFITEVFNKPYKWEWEDRQKMDNAVFSELSNEYRVKFKELASQKYVYIAKLTMNDSTEMTGLNDEFKVLATCMEIMEEFLREVEPTALQFKGSTSRHVEAYKRLMKYFGPKFSKFGYGYKLAGNDIRITSNSNIVISNNEPKE